MAEEEATSGISWAVEYENLSNRGFSKLKLSQPLSGRQEAEHTFEIGSEDQQDVLKTRLDSIRRNPEIKFRTIKSGQQGEWLTHVVYSARLIQPRGFGDTYLVLKSIDLFCWKMIRESGYQGYWNQDGLIGQHVTALCDEVGVTVEVKDEPQGIREFARLYRPGSSRWNFAYGHLLPRCPGVWWLRSRLGDDAVFGKLGGEDEWEIPTPRIHRTEDGDDMSAFINGGHLDGHWHDPTDFGEELSLHENADAQVEGQDPFLSSSRVLLGRGWHTRDAANCHFRHIQQSRVYPYPKSITISGSSHRDQEPWEPGFLIKILDDKVKTDQWCVGINHTIDNGSYLITLLGWRDKAVPTT